MRANQMDLREVIYIFQTYPNYGNFKKVSYFLLAENMTGIDNINSMSVTLSNI